MRPRDPPPGRARLRPRPRHAWIALLALLAGAAAAQDPPLSEHRVKAGFIYNFAKMIDWPPNRLPFRICVSGEERFDEVRQLLEGRAVGNRTITVRTAVPPTQLVHCEIAFIAGSQAPQLPALLAPLQGRRVLTIADTDGFAQQGVVINFYRAGDKLRFEINPDAAQRAGLKIGSRLLVLARIVHDTLPALPATPR